LSPIFICFSVEEAIKSGTNKKERYQNMVSQISEEIKELVANAKSLGCVGRYEEAAEVLSVYWKNTNKRPDVSALNKVEQGEILLRCGSLASYIGNCKQKKDAQELAQNLLFEARNLLWSLLDNEKRAECQTYLALTYMRTGKLDEARSLINSAFEIQIDEKCEVHLFSHVVDGMILLRERKYQDLVNKCKALETLFRKSSFLVLQGDFNNNYACALVKVGDRNGALSRFDLAKRFYDQTNHHLFLALVDNNLAIFFKNEQVYDEAHRAAKSARTNFKKLGDKTREGYSIDTRAQIYLAEGKLEEALKCVNEAIGILKRGENYSYLVNSMETKSHIQLYLKDYAESVKTTVEAIKIINLFSKKTDKRISIIEEKISSNFQKRWKMEELAEIVNLSKSRFEKLFKQELKISPMQFIKHLRLEKAKELLKTTLLTVKEIGFAVGINDQSGFVRDFKKKYGLTPTEYRKSFKS
jgi:AraC-like DNA-binding protein